MYVYFRPAATTQKKFDLGMTEAGNLPQNPLGPLLPGGSAQGFANQIGEGLLEHEIGRGFTVVRESDGSVQFSVGILQPGEKPNAPYARNGQKRIVYVNERIEVHSAQRDFVGPLEVPDDDMALYLTMAVEGAPTVDVLVYHRAVADGWLQSYLTAPIAGAPPGVPLLDETVNAMSGSVPGSTSYPQGSGQPYRRVVRVPKGSYFVVLDNTATAGRSSPPTAALDDRAALVNLAIELGDAP